MQCCTKYITKKCKSNDGPPPCYFAPGGFPKDKNKDKDEDELDETGGPDFITTTDLPGGYGTTTDPAANESCCVVWADPHVSGFDSSFQRKFPKYLSLLGLTSGAANLRPINVNSYDAGDFWLVRSQPLQIQGRFVRSAEFVPDRAAVGALVLGGPILDGKRLLVEPLDGHISWDGKLLAQGSLNANLTAGHLSLRSHTGPPQHRGPRSQVLEGQLPKGVRLRVVRFQRHLDTRITLPRSIGSVDGECGNFNGNSEDDTESQVEKRMGRLSVLSEESLFSKGLSP